MSVYVPFIFLSMVYWSVFLLLIFCVLYYLLITSCFTLDQSAKMTLASRTVRTMWKSTSDYKYTRESATWRPWETANVFCLKKKRKSWLNTASTCCIIRVMFSCLDSPVHWVRNDNCVAFVTLIATWCKNRSTVWRPPPCQLSDVLRFYVCCLMA